jgi:hypothetical protein
VDISFAVYVATDIRKQGAPVYSTSESVSTLCGMVTATDIGESMLRRWLNVDYQQLASRSMNLTATVLGTR